MAESAARLLSLLALLQARPQWTGAELAERLEVTGRTLRRDVERLRVLGYPVAAVRGVAGGYRLGAGAALPPLLLSDGEAVAVVIALRTAAVGGLSGVAATAVSALGKLEQILPARLRHKVSALGQSTLSLPRPGPAVDPEVLAVLALACRMTHRVRFAYTDHHEQPSRRRVEPHRLVFSGRYWYLVARDCDRAAWRSFRVDRITGATDTAERFVPRDPPDPVEFVAAAVTSAQYPHRARILFHAPVERVAEFFPPTVGVLETTAPGTCVLTTGSDSLDAIAMHLGLSEFEFAVLEPVELRDRVLAVADRLHRAARRAPEPSAAHSADAANSAGGTPSGEP